VNVPFTVVLDAERLKPVTLAVGVVETLVCVPPEIGRQAVRFGPDVDEMVPLFDIEEAHKVLQLPEPEEMVPVLFMVPVAVRKSEKVMVPEFVRLPVMPNPDGKAFVPEFTVTLPPKVAAPVNVFDELKVPVPDTLVVPVTLVFPLLTNKFPVTFRLEETVRLVFVVRPFPTVRVPATEIAPELVTMLPFTFNEDPNGIGVLLVKLPVTLTAPPIDMVPEFVVRLPPTVTVPPPEKAPLMVKLPAKFTVEPVLFTKLPLLNVKFEELKVPPLLLFMIPPFRVMGAGMVP
jgi:hypothetical protein